jgi:hypothetical protein
VPRFLPVPVNGGVVSCHDEIVKRYQVPINGREFSCHDETVKMTSKKQGTCASAHQPNDAVPGDETVMVPQYFISGTVVTRIDFGACYKFVLGWWKALN